MEDVSIEHDRAAAFSLDPGLARRLIGTTHASPAVRSHPSRSRGVDVRPRCNERAPVGRSVVARAAPYPFEKNGWNDYPTAGAPTRLRARDEGALEPAAGTPSIRSINVRRFLQYGTRAAKCALGTTFACERHCPMHSGSRQLHARGSCSLLQPSPMTDPRNFLTA